MENRNVKDHVVKNVDNDTYYGAFKGWVSKSEALRYTEAAANLAVEYFAEKGLHVEAIKC